MLKKIAGSRPTRISSPRRAFYHSHSADQFIVQPRQLCSHRIVSSLFRRLARFTCFPMTVGLPNRSVASESVSQDNPRQTHRRRSLLVVFRGDARLLVLLGS